MEFHYRNGLGNLNQTEVSMAGAPVEVEEALNNLAGEGGVTHYLIINMEGVPIRWSGWSKNKEVRCRRGSITCARS